MLHKPLVPLAAAATLIAACAPDPADEGATLYKSYCTSCHGPAAEGDGPLAATLNRPVPDLTQISARNGGTFPTAKVMSVIDGYSRAREGNVTMPEFGVELQSGPLVYYDTGDGRPVPTPSKLVALAEYLRSIQR